ncbi:MAG: HEAT repeat domain-containing protein [Blastocatellia bacterium]
MLETLLAEPLAAALAWALLHFIWQGTLAALLLAGLLRFLRSANARYAAACAALLLMAVLPLATMVSVSLSNSGKGPSRGTARWRPAVAGETADHPGMATIVSTGQFTATDSPWLWLSSLPESLAPLLPWTILFWLLGVVVCSLRLTGGWLCTQRLRSRGIRPMEEEWLRRLRRLCDELRVTRPVRLLESTLVAVPTAIGWLRPVILLPVSALTRLTPQQLESIIAHELAHIRRHDYLINLLQAVIETLLFYHPAVWWASRQVRREREHCCDDLAVAVCGDPLTYARALLEMEQLRAAEPQLAVAANGGLLMNRIERLVGVRTQPANRFAGLLACLIVLTTVVGVGVGAQILLPASNQSSASASQDDRAVEALLPALQDSSWNVRKAAVESLARLNNRRAAELLIAALRDQHPQVREQAVIGLGRRSDERLAEHLIAALTDNDVSVREQAAIALSRNKDARAVEPLLRALRDSEWQVREQAARSLGAIGSQQAVEALIDALKDRHEQVREAAAKSLGWIGDRRALEPLNQALQDEDEQVQKKAVEALGLLKQNDGESSIGALWKPVTTESGGLLDLKNNQLLAQGLLSDQLFGQASLLDAKMNRSLAQGLLSGRRLNSTGLFDLKMNQLMAANFPNTISLFSAPDELPAQEQITHRYQLSPSARVEVSYILGSVEIEGIDGDTAEVHIVRSANTQADLERFDRIQIEHTPARLVLRGEDSKSNGIEVRHRVRLRLPRNARIDLREINGRVHINGMEGAIRLNEVNGGARIPHLSGELEMSSVNGRIDIGLARLVPGGITLHDVGAVELQVADGVNADLEIDELDALLLETPRASLQQRGEKKFQVRIGAGGPVIRIIDVRGQVRIRNA